MKLRCSSSRWAALLLSGVLALAGCSGDQEEPSEPAEDASESEEPAEPTEDEPAPEPEPTMEEPAPAADPEPLAMPAPTTFQGNKVVRYVTSYALNVRGEPSKDSPVTGHVKRGDRLEVVINGEWAMIAPGKFVAVSRLSETDPTAKPAKAPAKKSGKRN